MLEHLPLFCGDSILLVNEAFGNDRRQQKVNLSIGIYFNERGEVPILDSVRGAETLIFFEKSPKHYLPIEGAAATRQAISELLFGNGHDVISSNRCAVIQTVGSSSAIKLGADFIRRWFPESQVWVSQPTWSNHVAIFESCGIQVHFYPYYDSVARQLAFDLMLETISRLPTRSVVVLHCGCHNPTGVDLSKQQWDQVISEMQRASLVPFIDLAYQGLGYGIEEDAYPIRAMANAGLTFFVANSFSKNMSIYGERAGGLTLIAKDRNQANLAFGQLQAIVRCDWSNPPTHAGAIISTVLCNPVLRTTWISEVDVMRRRMVAMRQLLHRFCRINCAAADLVSYALSP